MPAYSVSSSWATASDPACESDWEPVRIEAAGLQPHMRRSWDSDPAWDVHAVYAEPDEWLVSADSTIRRAAYWNRHIDRRFRLEYPRSRRDAPRSRSRSVGDPEAEWQLVQEHVDRYLADAGLTRESPPEAIARCLAATWRYEPYFAAKPMCPSFPESPRELTNPIEGLLYKSFCVGCAHALAALADAAGLPARTIGLGAHRIAEIRVNGRWHMTENSCRHEGHEDLSPWFPVSFMEVGLHPERYADLMPKGKPANYLRCPNGQYHFMGEVWQSSETLRFAASNAYALYPELSEWGLKADDDPSKCPIVLRRNGFYWQNAVSSADDARARQLRRETVPFPVGETVPASDFLYHPLAPGQALRQSVWLGDLDGMTGLEVAIPVAPEPQLDFGPALGRDLWIEVNDFQASLSELGAWPGTEPDNRGHRVCRVRVPVGALAARSVNWIVLRNGSGETFQAPFVPSAMQPYIPPLLREE